MPFILPEMSVRTKSLLIANRAICPTMTVLFDPSGEACMPSRGFGLADSRQAHRLIAC